MPWFTDTLQVLALLVTSAGVSAAAYLAARRLGLDRMWRIEPTAPRSTEQLVERLARLADAARSGGIMSIEAAAAEFRLPMLDQGLKLIIAGRTTSEIRQTLESEFNRSILNSKGEGAAVIGSHLLAAIGLAGLIACVSAASGLALSSVPTYPSLLVAAIGLPAAVAIPVSVALRRRAGSSIPRRILDATLAIETVSLISDGRDGVAVRTLLCRLLPLPGQPLVGQAAA